MLLTRRRHKVPQPPDRSAEHRIVGRWRGAAGARARAALGPLHRPHGESLRRRSLLDRVRAQQELQDRHGGALVGGGVILGARGGVDTAPGHTRVARGGVGAAPAAVAARACCGHLERRAQQRRHPTMEPRGDADAALAPVEEQQRAYRIRAMRTHRAHTMHTPCVHRAHTVHTLCTHRAHTVHTPCAQHACAPVEEQQPLRASPPQLGGLAQRVALAAHVARLTREVQRQHGEQRVCGGMQPRLELLTQPRLGKRVGAASGQVDPAGACLVGVRWQREGHLVRVRVRVRVRLGVVW
eukprot:scaffold87717_cov64-Phaeocystis_antarctica.AAC.1